ncbi:MAG: molybdopterin-dependent oxidoreductase [bacterium]|nr:molybdopterin-dependent oxidoreductase [bacterium]
MRRGGFLAFAAAGMLAGCGRLGDTLTESPLIHRILAAPERLDLALLGAGQPLAREYTARDLSPVFRRNGFDPPSDERYVHWSRSGWLGYRLFVRGLVERPQSFSLYELRNRFARRDQITRHDCVEGWSVIGKWSGPRLGDVLSVCRPTPRAKFVVFHCMDDDNQGTRYYESLDLRQAYHPQALLAYALNDQPVPVENGAPIRLKVPTQLGYKSAKYVQAIELVPSLGGAYGNGGYWEDQGYEWYAGV